MNIWSIWSIWNNWNHRHAILAVSLGALPLLASACDPQDELLSQAELDADAVADDDPGDGFRTWTGYVSEEDPPLVCPNNHAVGGFDCRGRYCDDVAMDCQYIPNSTIGGNSWTPSFSEEGTGTADEGHCWSSNQWMTGVSCSGRYCDNLSLQCTTFQGSSTGPCYWSSWYSEEQSPFYTPTGYYIKGMECDGDYCDNKRFRYCRML